MNDAVRDSLQNIRASILLIQRRVIGYRRLLSYPLMAS